MQKDKIIAAYVRVSTLEQNLESQKAEILNYLNNHGIDIGRVVWYQDKDSGANLRRPQFEKLQRDIFNGKVSTVVLWKLDRLSRNLRDGINVLADWADRGLRVVSVIQHIEFNGTMGKIVSALMLGLAEMELSHNKERQRAGIDAAKKRGVYKGRKPGSVKADAERARVLRDKGNTASEIATSLGISERTVFRYLRS
jgi:DNA invertase Pin-like site-specific DNA recombinase